jgi:voltage-gated sodium channel
MATGDNDSSQLKEMSAEPVTNSNPGEGETQPHAPTVYAWPAGQKEDDHKEHKPEGLFAFKDPLTMKEQVRKCLEKSEPYSVYQFYKDEEDSIWPRIAKNPVFENTTLAVIAINAVYIAIDTDWNKPDPLECQNTYSLQESGAFFQFMEHSFCVYFTFEWIARFMSFKSKANCGRDAWFVFDSILVFMMVMETWVIPIIMSIVGGESPIGGTSILRLFRLLRLSRLMRMLRSLPELMILIKGMASAMKSVAYVMALLLLILYVFGIAFTQLAVGMDIGEAYFCNVAHAMYSLLIYATFLDDLSAFTDDLRASDSAAFLLILTFLFVALAALTVMNMLIGVLCEVVTVVADRERDEIRTETLSEKMKEIVASLDENFDGKISYREFTEIMAKPDALAALDDVGVSPVGIVDFAELFFFEDGKPIELKFETFMEVILELRETNTATVKDMLNLWMKIKMNTNKDLATIKAQAEGLNEKVSDKMKHFNEQQSAIENTVSTMLSEVKKITSKIPDA